MASTNKTSDIANAGSFGNWWESTPTPAKSVGNTIATGAGVKMTPPAVAPAIAPTSNPYTKTGGTGIGSTTGGSPSVATNNNTVATNSSTYKPAPGSQESAQAWINNPASGQGGMDAYIAKQQEKLNNAIATNDTDMLSRLNADMARVGYTLKNPNEVKSQGIVAPTGSTPNMGIFAPGSYGGYDPAAQEKAYLEMQLSSLGGQRDAARLAAQYGIDQNSAYLKEQLASLGEQEAIDKQSAQELQNRRGGFYSGGLDYQLGGIDRGYTQAQSSLGRDVASRNQQLLDQYGNQANAIAQQIQTLQFNQPDILRQRIVDWVNNERDYGLNYANTFGNLNGLQTEASRNADRNYQLNLAGLSGQLPSGGQTLAAQQQAIDNAYRQNAFDVGNQQWQQQFDLNKSGQAFDQQQAQKQFDENVRQFGLDYAIQQQQLKQSAANAAADNAIQWYNANTNRQQENRLATQGSGGSGSSNYDYKTDPKFLSEVALATTDPKFLYNDILAHTQEYIDAYGYDGYNNLWNRVKDQAPKQ